MPVTQLAGAPAVRPVPAGPAPNPQGPAAPLAAAPVLVPDQAQFSRATFVGANAEAAGDGALKAPDGQRVPGAPAPGQGRVSPTGLTGGNTVIRYGADGTPANFTILNQGATNGCGSTSCAMMMNYLSRGNGYSRERVDRDIRNFNLFSSPGEIANYAESQGMRASLHTNTTLADLRGMVDQGLPVQIMLDVFNERNITGWHYEVVTGYGRGADGTNYFELANPWGQREYIAESELMRRWSNLPVQGQGTPLSRVAIFMKPANHPATLPSDVRTATFNPAAPALRAAQGVTQVTNGFANGDGARVAEGAARALGNGLAAVPTLAGTAGRQAGNQLMLQGQADLGTGFTGNVRGAARVAAGMYVHQVSTGLEAAGEVAARANDLAASGVGAVDRGAQATGRGIRNGVRWLTGW